MSGIKSIARSRPSHGKGRTRTFARGLVELTWCAGVLAGASYLWTLPELERSRTLDPLLQGEVRAAGFAFIVASAPVLGGIGLYRVLAAALDLVWPGRRIVGTVVDRGTVDGGPWTPEFMSDLVATRSNTTMRWVTVVDEGSGRARTLHVTNRDRWFAGAPGARVCLVATGVLSHVRSVEVITPAPPMVANAPFAPPSGPVAARLVPAAVA